MCERPRLECAEDLEALVLPIHAQIRPPEAINLLDAHQISIAGGHGWSVTMPGGPIAEVLGV
jgi:hypothetical protein